MNSKSALLIISASFLASALSACSRGNNPSETKITPLTPQQRQALMLAIHTGHAPLPENDLAEDSTASRCSTFISELPKNFIHGTVQVPEDWSAPEGRKIQVFYYGRKESPSPNALPVVFFNGGPSSDSHSSYPILEREEAAQQAPFIYIDQRGNGCSDPYPTEPSAETALRLSHYGTRSIVKDAEAVREAVFGADSKWRIFGQSYGGMIVQRYLTLAPAQVESAFAHGYSVMTDPVEWLKFRITSQSRVGDDYFQEYPLDRKAIARIRSSIPENACFTDGDNRVCGPSVIDAATLLLGFSDSWPTLHKWISAIDGHPGTNQRFLEQFIRQYVFGVYAADNIFAASIIARMEMNLGATDREQCAEVRKRLAMEGRDYDTLPINECRLLSTVTNAVIDPLVVATQVIDPIRLDDLIETLDAHPAIRFYLYSGQKDVFVPTETFQEEATRLGSRVRYRSFPSSGHEGFYTEPQIWEDVMAQRL